MSEKGLDGRVREKSGQIDHKHPTTKIKHLRDRYGHKFAEGWDGEKTLGELLKDSGFESLTQYVKHHGLKSQRSLAGAGLVASVRAAKEWRLGVGLCSFSRGVRGGEGAGIG